MHELSGMDFHILLTKLEVMEKLPFLSAAVALDLTGRLGLESFFSFSVLDSVPQLEPPALSCLFFLLREGLGNVIHRTPEEWAVLRGPKSTGHKP